jgi:hypothetical protein
MNPTNFTALHSDSCIACDQDTLPPADCIYCNGTLDTPCETEGCDNPRFTLRHCDSCSDDLCDR